MTKKPEYIISLILGAALIASLVFYIFAPKNKGNELQNNDYLEDYAEGEILNASPEASSTEVAAIKANSMPQKQQFPSLAEKAKKYKLAPELSSIDGYINTGGKPVTLSALRGNKVVLLDIWTYSCINCQRTIPYINTWYDKYKGEGLEIVGLHTPEFSFEKVEENVAEAVKEKEIKYPVVLDNDYSTWKALGNQFWPRKYLIDMDGFIVYDHIGEGGYEDTEKAIQKALSELKARKGLSSAIPQGFVNPKDAIDVNSGDLGSPETYFGSSRNQLLGNGAPGRSEVFEFTLPKEIQNNVLYLEGKWNIEDEYAENKSEASVVYKFKARNVYMVASASEELPVEIWQDEKLLKTIMVKSDALYHLVENASYNEHTLKIKIPKAGLKAFTFTFG